MFTMSYISSIIEIALLWKTLCSLLGQVLVINLILPHIDSFSIFFFFLIVTTFLIILTWWDNFLYGLIKKEMNPKNIDMTPPTYPQAPKKS